MKPPRILTGSVSRHAIAAALCCCFAAAPAPVQAAHKYPEAKGCSRPIRVAATPSGRSIMVTRKGKVSGIVIDFLARVARRSGCSFVYVPMSNTRAAHLLENGGIDIVPTMTRNEEQNRWGAFTYLYSNRPALIAFKGRLPDHIRLAKLMDGRTRLGVLRGLDYGRQYIGLLNDPRMVMRIAHVYDAEALARMLAAGRMDALLMPPAAIVDAAQQAGILDRLAVTPVSDLPYVSGGLYLSTHDLPKADIVKLYDAASALARRGEYFKLVQQYHAQPDWALNSLKRAP